MNKKHVFKVSDVNLLSPVAAAEKAEFESERIQVCFMYWAAL